jgi:hypothetical protein
MNPADNPNRRGSFVCSIRRVGVGVIRPPSVLDPFPGTAFGNREGDQCEADERLGLDGKGLANPQRSRQPVVVVV